MSPKSSEFLKRTFVTPRKTISIALAERTGIRRRKRRRRRRKRRRIRIRNRQRVRPRLQRFEDTRKNVKSLQCYIHVRKRSVKKSAITRPAGPCSLVRPGWAISSRRRTWKTNMALKRLGRLLPSGEVLLVPAAVIRVLDFRSTYWRVSREVGAASTEANEIMN